MRIRPTRNRMVQQPIIHMMVVVGICCHFPSSSTFSFVWADESARVHVAARTFQSPSTEPVVRPTDVPATVGTTIPTRSAVYNVYGLDRKLAQLVKESHDGDDKIFLHLGADRSICVALSATINGAPFRMARQQVIDSLFEPDADADRSGMQASHEIQKRFQAYQRASADVARDEVHWLLSQWTPGPELLVYASNRGNHPVWYRPIWDLLDRDTDNRLSKTETAAAIQSIKKADRNENELIESAEIHRLRKNAKQARKTSAPLMEIASVGKPTRIARTRFAEWQVDLTVRAALGDQIADPGLTVVAHNSDLEVTADPENRAILVNVPGYRVELVAINGKEPSDQISIGAVSEGATLLRHLDKQADGRLSPREYTRVSSMLDQFDDDQDGVLSVEEVGTTVRVAIALGPTVHNHIQQKFTESDPPSARKVPAWFASMDRNGDGDVSQSEFLGSDAKFTKFDHDDDKLISLEEASQVRGE